MNPIQLIAALCAIHTGDIDKAAYQQAKCHQYYMQCSLELSDGEKTPEDKIKICMMARPAQIFSDQTRSRK